MNALDSQADKGKELISEHLEPLVRAELIRTGIGHIVQRSESSALSQFLRHPLTSLFIGFALTAVLGSALSHFYSLQQEEFKREQRAFDEGIQAIEDFSRLVYRRYTVASMLESAFHRGFSLEEVGTRKAQYDEVFIEWGTELQAQMLTIRRILGQVRFSESENYVQSGLVPLLRGHGGCLTSAYDDLRRGGFSRRDLIKCNVRDLRRNALNCSYAITSGLFIIVNDARSGSDNSRLPAIVGDNIKVGCLDPVGRLDA